MLRRHDFDNLKMENILINAKLLKQFEDKNYNLILWDTILCKSVVFPHKAPPGTLMGAYYQKIENSGSLKFDSCANYARKFL